MKPQTKGLKRLIHATRYSLQGLRALWRTEAAFRQEAMLSLLLTPVIIMVDVPSAERALLVATLLLVLITEMLNSAIEVVIDRIGHDHHELSGRAKDMGSAAVMFSLIGAAIIWAIVLWPS
ncbi:diacylglycerol kinase [Pseudohongiella acticola]|uniref:Diacylglycerol kinase n=1 Tax=Pseudohongiella acticola TaxID=1524254 RepID=A0A1E8CMS4_9GAMM|nr:diacylglycerol kinase [Pseudohongiella acticola]OFE13572.1 diacylglycerol kinase [Pseudohongiella acticola]